MLGVFSYVANSAGLHQFPARRQAPSRLCDLIGTPWVVAAASCGRAAVKIRASHRQYMRSLSEIVHYVLSIFSRVALINLLAIRPSR